MKLCNLSSVFVFVLLFFAARLTLAEEEDLASSVPNQEMSASEPNVESPDMTANQSSGSTAEPEETQPTAEPEESQLKEEPKEPQLMAEPEEKEEEKDEIFNWFTVAPEAGYVFFPGAEMEYQGFKTTVDPRNGFIAKLHFDFGGDGFAVELAPIFEVQAGGIEVKTATLSGLEKGGSFQGVGGQLSLVYGFKAGYFFPKLGLSFHGTYLMGDRIVYGTELYGRLPVGFSIYMGKHIALVFEVGLMYGVTGIRTPIDWENLDLLAGTGVEGIDDQAVEELKRIKTTQELDAWLSENRAAIEESGVDPNELYHEVANNAVASAMRFGRGFGLDITIGLRFP